MSIEFYSHGACQEVTGSKHFITTGRHTLMVDCGMFQGRRKEAYQKNLNLPFAPHDVDAVILTHAHFDHSGNLPSLLTRGYAGSIFCTPATRDLASLILLDSAHIQQMDAQYALKKGKGFVPDPLYDQEDVAQTLEAMVAIGYRRPFAIPGGRVTFLDAGHILGSSLVVIELEDGPTVAFSGDLGRPGLPILRDPQILPPADYLVLEGTYGDRLHEKIEDAEVRLAVVKRIVESEGKLIIPAFAVERTQELVYFLHLLSDRGAIPRGLPIFVDSPMAVNATSIFRMHPECFDAETWQAFLLHDKNPFGFAGLHYVTNVEDSKALNRMPGPMIIISASGMCEAGRILHHLKNTIEDPSNTVLIVGFMAENTLGRKLVEKHQEVNIFGEPYRVRAKIEKINAFSAHADYNEIVEYLEKMDRSHLRETILVHGEPDALTALESRLHAHGVKQVTVAEAGKRYSLAS
jgi:metallo-beta-lactamase family protein